MKQKNRHFHLKHNFFAAIKILLKEKKKRPCIKSIFEYLNNNKTSEMLEKEVEQYLN